MSGSELVSDNTARRNLWHAVSLALIVMVALLLRLYRLDRVPPGMTHDEGDTGYFFAAAWRGQLMPVEAPYGYAYEPLPMLTGAAFMHLLGPTELALRLHSVFFGMILLGFTYLWGRRAFGPAVGLGGAALLGISFWTVCDSRLALNSQPAPALFTAAAYFLWRALDLPPAGEPPSPLSLPPRRSCWWAWGMFALSLAGSLYVYEAARGAVLAFLALGGYLALRDRNTFRRYKGAFIGALLVAGALAAPHLLDPGAWGRTNTLSGPLQAALGGDGRPLAKNVLSGLGTISVRGDSFVTYNLPGRPIFDPLVSLFFYAGVWLCLRRWREPAYAFTLMWLAAGLLPTLVLGAYTSTLHSKVAEASMMILPALAIVEAGRWIGRRRGAGWRRTFTVGWALWLAVVAARTGYDYFVRWGESPATRAAYFHYLAAMTDYLNTTPYQGTVTLSSLFPDLPLDPFIADMRLRRDGRYRDENDLTLRWCDARRALVFPAAPTPAEALLMIPAGTPLAPELADRLPSRYIEHIERVALRPDDAVPYFDVFSWRPTEAAHAILGEMDSAVRVGDRATTLPLDFGGVVSLLGYTLSPSQPVAGESLSVVTAWQVRDPSAFAPPPPTEYGYAAVVFVHVLDESDTLIAQEDRLDAPAWDWHPGDVFVQVHRVAWPASGAEGRPARIVVGLYTRADGVRLPLMVDGVVVGDGIELWHAE